MRLLSIDAIKKYNYSKTKNNVDKFMEPLAECIFKYSNLTPPSITYQFKKVIIDISRSNTSSTEKYVMKKLDTEEKLIEYYSIINEITSKFNKEESDWFSLSYKQGITDEEIAEVLKVSPSYIYHIKRSAIIKFALALNMVVMN